MEFELAKKIEKMPAKSKGNTLRSINADKTGARAIIVADTYGGIKSQSESFRIEKNCDINFKMRGKSIEILILPDESCQNDFAINLLMEFLSSINFNSKDSNDITEFWNKNMPLDSCNFVMLDLSNGRMKLVLETENLDQDLQSKIMEKVDEYEMGLVKITG